MGTYHTLKTVVALGLLAGLQALWAQPLSGNYTIKASPNPANNEFGSIQAAFNALNQRGASGIVNFIVDNSWNPASEPNTITLAGYACSSCQVTLDFSSLTTSKVLAKAPAGTRGNRFVFRFGGHT